MLLNRRSKKNVLVAMVLMAGWCVAQVISGGGGGTTGSTIIDTNRTYFVCTVGAGPATCSSSDPANGWNGNVTPSPVISDANTCTTVAAPCATMAGAIAKFNNKFAQNAIVTVYTADQTNTGTDCLQDNNIILYVPSTGGNPYNESEASQTGVYPPAYVYLYGNVTDHTKVTAAGNGCGVSGTIGSKRNFIVAAGGTVLRIRGMQLEGYGKTDTSYAPTTYASTGSMLFYEDMDCIRNVNHMSCGAAMGTGASIRLGGTLNVSGSGLLGHGAFLTAFGAQGYTWGPLASASANTVINTSASGTSLFHATQSGFWNEDRVKWTNTGANALIQFANLWGVIAYTEAYPVSACPAGNGTGGGCFYGINNAAGVTYQLAQEGGFIDADCLNFIEGSCTATQQVATHSKVGINGFVREYDTGGSNGAVFPFSTAANINPGTNGCISHFLNPGENAICGSNNFTLSAAATAAGQVGYDTTQQSVTTYDTLAAAQGTVWRLLSVQNSTTDTVDCPTFTTNERSFASTFKIPANFLINKKVLRVTFMYVNTSPGAPTTFRGQIRLSTTNQSSTTTPAGTLIYQPPAATPSVNQTAIPFPFSFMLQGTAAPGGAVAVAFMPINGGQVPFPLTQAISSGQTVATNGDLWITISNTCGANTAGQSVTLGQLLVEAGN